MRCLTWISFGLVAAGCGGGSVSGNFLDPDEITLTAGEDRDLDVRSNRTVHLVVTATPPAGVSFDTESGLGTNHVDMQVETEASTAPGTYHIRITAHHSADFNGATSEDHLKLIVEAP